MFAVDLRLGRLVWRCSGWMEGRGAASFPCLLEIPYDRVPLPGNGIDPLSRQSPQPLPTTAFYSSLGAPFITHPLLPIAALNVMESSVFLGSGGGRVTGIDSWDHYPCSVNAKGARPALNPPHVPHVRLSSAMDPVDKFRPVVGIGVALRHRWRRQQASVNITYQGPLTALSHQRAAGLRLDIIPGPRDTPGFPAPGARLPPANDTITRRRPRGR